MAKRATNRFFSESYCIILLDLLLHIQHAVIDWEELQKFIIFTIVDFVAVFFCCGLLNCKCAHETKLIEYYISHEIHDQCYCRSTIYYYYYYIVGRCRIENARLSQ